MDQGDVLFGLIAACVSAVPGIIALWQNRTRPKVEIEKIEAETQDIHAQVADKWAAHVGTLQIQLERLERTEQAGMMRIGILESSVLSLQVENTSLLSQVSVLANGVRILSGQVRELGHDPKWIEPEPWQGVERRRGNPIP